MVKPLKKQPAAPTPESEVKALLREVDDTLHYERMNDLWKTWKMPILAALVMLIVGVMGKSWYENYAYEQKQTEAKEFWSAVQNPDKEAAFTALSKIAEEQDGGFAMMSLFNAAAMKANDGEDAAALEFYEQIAADKGVSATFKDLAKVYGAQAAIGAGNLEKAEDMAGDVAVMGNPFRSSGLEALALVAEAKGEMASALEFYEAIGAEVNAPASIKRRAQARISDIQQLIKQ